MVASDCGVPQPGLSVGPTSEFSLFFRLKPGQGPSLRAALVDLQETPGYRPGDYGMAVQTIHEARFVMFDDDTRLAFVTSFDGPWDAYMEDFFTSGPAFTDPGSIFLDGKNVLSIVVEIDTSFLWGRDLVGAVAETLTRGTFNVRIERVGRPEVKNMMLAPKEFDPVNRDLEIRDLYNMEDAFHLGDSYQGAYRARLDANLAFWDGLDGKVDWPAEANGSHPLTDLVLADYLIVDVTKPYVEHGTFLEIELAARRGEAHQTCGGRTLNDDVMDTIFTQLVNAGHGPTIRDGVDSATRPATSTFPYLATPNPNPPEPPEHH